MKPTPPPRQEIHREQLEADRKKAADIDPDDEMIAFVEELRAAAYERRGAQPEGLEP